MRKLTSIILILAFSLGMFFTAGCQNEAQTDALVGSLIGAGVGQLAGGDTESTLIGAGVGAGAGYIIGNEADKNK